MSLSVDFKPLLAGEVDLKSLKFPVYASPKLDGIRAITGTGRDLFTRSLKQVPNQYIKLVLESLPPGLDGELVVGDPTDKNVYNKTSSGVMSKDGEPEFTFLVFDYVNPGFPFHSRLRDSMSLVSAAKAKVGSWVEAHEHVLVESLQELLKYEEGCLENGYEGLILRDPDGRYKFGRSTTKEGIMLKLKRFEDAEAEILEVVQLMSNENQAQVNELGRTFRSSSKEGLVPMPMVGAFRVRDVKEGWEFNIGSGSAFTHESRTELWADRDNLIGKLVKYKFFRHGMKDVPRHPNFLGFRDKKDL